VGGDLNEQLRDIQLVLVDGGSRTAIASHLPAAHFTRRLVIPEVRLGDWAAVGASAEAH